jgi:hypothetical protein
VKKIMGIVLGILLALSMAGVASAAPITCPGGQTAERTDSGWACVSNGGETTGAGWHKGTDAKL